MTTEVPRIDVCRVYDSGDDRGDGYVALVDRLWPRGVAKADVAFDEWVKDVAPSTELRRWYGHEVERFGEFAQRYDAELRSVPARAAVERLATIAARERVVLLTATRDVEHSGAEVLRRHLLRIVVT